MSKEKKYDLLGFGEAMIRFTAPDHARLEQCSHLHIAIAAAELNVSVNVSRLGLKTAWVSKLVDIWSGNTLLIKAASMVWICRKLSFFLLMEKEL